jgi:MFS family permease
VSTSPQSSEAPRAQGVVAAPSPVAVPERLWTRAFLRVLLVQVTFGFAFSAFFLLPKFLARELGATPSQIGSVTGVNVFAAVLAVPALWWAIDRIPRHRLLVFGTLLGAGAAYGHVWIDEIGAPLYVLRALQGIAFVITFNTAATLAVELSPKQRLSQTLGFFGLAMLCTNAIAPAIIEPLVAALGWSFGFQLAAAAALIAAFVARGVTSPTRAEAIPRVSVFELLDRRALCIYYTSALTGLGFGTLVTYTQPFALSLGAELVSPLFIGYTIAAITVRLALGSLADRVGRRAVALASLVLYSLVLLATTQLQADWLFGIGMGLGVSHGLLYPALNALLVEATPVGARGIVMTSYNGAFNLGFALSVVGFGTIAEVAGFPTVFLVASLLSFTGVFALALIPAGRADTSP